MLLDYAVKAIFAQILIYFIMCKIFTGKLHKSFAVCPVLNIIIFMLFFLNPPYIIGFAANIALCILLPIFSIKNININGLIPKDFFNPADLCIVFGNALDNAIEACLKLQNDIQKNITVTIKQKSTFLLIKITNPAGEGVYIKNNTVVSTKN